MKQSIQEAVCSKLTINIEYKGALEVVVLSDCTVINLNIFCHFLFFLICLESRLKKSEICNLRGLLLIPSSCFSSFLYSLLMVNFDSNKVNSHSRSIDIDVRY